MQLFLGLTGVHRAAPGLGFWVPAAALWALSLVGFWGILGRDQRRLTILQVERGWDPDGSDRGRETRGSQAAGLYSTAQPLRPWGRRGAAVVLLSGPYQEVPQAAPPPPRGGGATFAALLPGSCSRGSHIPE